MHPGYPNCETDGDIAMAVTKRHYISWLLWCLSKVEQRRDVMGETIAGQETEDDTQTQAGIKHRRGPLCTRSCWVQCSSLPRWARLRM